VESELAKADLPGGLYLVAATVVTIVATWILWRRMQRLAA
jgi:hypothetical protein